MKEPQVPQILRNWKNELVPQSLKALGRVNFLTEATNIAAGRRIITDIDPEHSEGFAADGSSKLKFATWADVQMRACLRG